MKELTFSKALIGLLLPVLSIIALVLSGNDIVIALLTANIVAAIFCLVMGFKWQAIEDAMMKGGQMLLGAVLIMILVGITVGTWMASGAIPTLLYFGMKIISPMWFLPVTFILCLLTSLATGTSWGSAGTMGVAMIGVGTGMGIPLPLICGCILSGAVIGDKLSPLSDTTLLASASSGTDLFDHIMSMLYTTVPLGIISIIAYFVCGLKYANASMQMENITVLMDGLTSAFNINFLMLIPPIVVLVLSIKRVPAFCSFGLGIILSVIFAIAFQGETLNSVLSAAVGGYTCTSGVEQLDNLLSRGGALGMAQVAFASIMAGMLAGILKHMGILAALLTKLHLIVKSSTSLIVVTVCTCLILMMGGGGQYATLTIPGAAFREFYDDMDVHSGVLSRTMEDVGTMIDCLIPWTVSGIYYSGIFGVATMDYFPFAFMALLSPIFALVNAFLGFGVYYRDDQMAYRPFWRRSKHLNNKV